MKILITGGAGFIGSHIAERMMKKGHQVVVFDNLYQKSKWQMPNNIEFIQDDVRNIEALEMASKDVDYIFHQAALISGVESFEKPEETIEVNAGGTLNVLTVALKNNVKKVLFASSCAVYGDNLAPHKEDTALNPKSPYAISKMNAEISLMMYFKKHGLKTSSLRYFNVYGPRQDSDSAYAAVIPIFIKNALNDKPLIIYGDGLQTRDFISVHDVVSANELLMEKGDGKIFNIASGIETNLNDLAEMIINLTGSNSTIIHEKVRDKDIYKSKANISKIKDNGFEPKINLEQGLKALIEYVR